MIIRSDLKVEHVTSGYVPSPEPDVTQLDVPLPRMKVKDEDVVHFFACKTEATFIDVAEVLQVIRQTISRNVSRLVEEGRQVREGKHLIVVANPEKE